jgi:hypothetical protein
VRTGSFERLTLANVKDGIAGDDCHILKVMPGVDIGLCIATMLLVDQEH